MSKEHTEAKISERAKQFGDEFAARVGPELDRAGCDAAIAAVTVLAGRVFEHHMKFTISRITISDGKVGYWFNYKQ